MQDQMSPVAEAAPAHAEQSVRGELFPDLALGDWVVLHTMSRCEKALSDEMWTQKIPHFLPLFRRVRYYGRRKMIVKEPMFPGYVFLRGEIEDAYRAARSKRIANIIRVADQEKFDDELRNLWLAIDCGAELNPYPALKAGVRVEVSSGPFRGLQGIIENSCRPNRLILQVDMLGRAVSLEVDGALLDVI